MLPHPIRDEANAYMKMVQKCTEMHIIRVIDRVSAVHSRAAKTF